MKKLMMVASMAFAVVFAACSGNKQKVEDENENGKENENVSELKTDMDSLSYSFGVMTGEDYAGYGILDVFNVDSVNYDDFFNGMNDYAMQKEDKAKNAEFSGLMIGNEIIQRVVPTFNVEHFPGDSLHSVSVVEMFTSFTNAISGSSSMTTEDAKKVKENFKNNGDDAAAKELSMALGVLLASDFNSADMMGRLGVDSAYIADFNKSVMELATLSKDDKARWAYISGLQMGNDVASRVENINSRMFGEDDAEGLSLPIVLAAVKASLCGKDMLMDREQAMNVQNNFAKKQTEKKYADNKKAGEDFLAENKTKEGVVTTESGLQYKVITEGNGPKPTADQKVKVHYEGRLIDGSVFDSSLQRNEPAVFGVTQVIPGWVEALQLMPVGSEWELYIPQELAYGDRGAGQMIKPFSALIFKVQLLGIEE